jgi:hypothetical protein
MPQLTVKYNFVRKNRNEMFPFNADVLKGRCHQKIVQNIEKLIAAHAKCSEYVRL